jgi:hypothetical protein
MPSSLQSREPAYCRSHRFALQSQDRTPASPRRAQSLRGHTQVGQRASHGITRRPPLVEWAAAEGFAVMSGIDVRDHSHTGQEDLPDKEFRWICYLMTTRGHDSSTGGLALASLPASPQGPDHLILFPLTRKEGRRMASEDSQNLGWLPMIHRLCHLRDLDDAFHREMPAELHQTDDLGELGEVLTLRCSQRVLLEERNDDVLQVTESPDGVPREVLAVIVRASIRVDLPAPEESDEVLQNAAARGALDDDKFGTNLPSKRHLAAAVDGAAKAALPVYEPHDPSNRRESFLLVFRTSHIVTADHATHPTKRV